MADTANTPFSQEEICAQAQGNAAAWILTMIAYLKERGLPVEDCVAYHGRRFAPAWEELRGRPVEEVAHLVALNTPSVGNTLRSLSSEDGHAELLVEGSPDEEFLRLLPLDRDGGDRAAAVDGGLGEVGPCGRQFTHLTGHIPLNLPLSRPSTHLCNVVAIQEHQP